MQLLLWQGDNGTRLGHNGPKGTFMVEIQPKRKSLFEILADTLKKANADYQVSIPWYIMVSKENKEDTIQFFEKQEYFGYKKEKVVFFEQGEMPLIGEDKQFLLTKQGKIQMASDGNGSIYFAMKEKGILEDMKQKGIEWVFIGAVDNILLKMIEPLLLGLTITQNHEIASKTILKANAQEKVGVFCRKNGKPSVMEYTELPQELAEEKNEKQEFVYGDSHIMCNLFSLSALEKIAQKTLPYHIAYKKSKETEENYYKLEQFIFDSFPFFEEITLLRGKREEDFAPIKNAVGIDSPETAIVLYQEYQKRIKRKE